MIGVEYNGVGTVVIDTTGRADRAYIGSQIAAGRDTSCTVDDGDSIRIHLKDLRIEVVVPRTLGRWDELDWVRSHALEQLCEWMNADRTTALLKALGECWSYVGEEMARESMRKSIGFYG